MSLEESEHPLFGFGQLGLCRITDIERRLLIAEERHGLAGHQKAICAVRKNECLLDLVPGGISLDSCECRGDALASEVANGFGLPSIVIRLEDFVQLLDNVPCQLSADQLS